MSCALEQPKVLKSHVKYTLLLGQVLDDPTVYCYYHLVDDQDITQLQGRSQSITLITKSSPELEELHVS